VGAIIVDPGRGIGCLGLVCCSGAGKGVDLGFWVEDWVGAGVEMGSVALAGEPETGATSVPSLDAPQPMCVAV